MSRKEEARETGEEMARGRERGDESELRRQVLRDKRPDSRKFSTVSCDERCLVVGRRPCAHTFGVSRCTCVRRSKLGRRLEMLSGGWKKKGNAAAAHGAYKGKSLQFCQFRPSANCNGPKLSTFGPALGSMFIRTRANASNPSRIYCIVVN